MVIKNVDEPNKPYVVLVHANKNYGIIDLILGTNVKETILVNGKKVKKMTFVPERRLSEFLPTFQGQQYNSELTAFRLTYILTEKLNSK